MIIIQTHVTKNEMWHSGAAIRNTDRLQILMSGRAFTSSSNEPEQIYTREDNNANLHTWILLPTNIISGESKVAV